MKAQQSRRWFGFLGASLVAAVFAGSAIAAAPLKTWAPGETLTEFVETSVRRAVEFRRVQTDFAARCDASLAAYERTGISIPSDVVLSKLEAKVAARVKQLRK